MPTAYKVVDRSLRSIWGWHHGRYQFVVGEEVRLPVCFVSKTIQRSVDFWLRHRHLTSTDRRILELEYDEADVQGPDGRGDLVLRKCRVVREVPAAEWPQADDVWAKRRERRRLGFGRAAARARKRQAAEGRP